MVKTTTTSFKLSLETKHRIDVFMAILEKKKKDIITVAINALAEKLAKEGVINLDQDTKAILTEDFQKSIKSAKLRKQATGNRKIYLQRDIKL